MNSNEIEQMKSYKILCNPMNDNVKHRQILLKILFEISKYCYIMKDYRIRAYRTPAFY